jgi:hypothetical protein
VQRYLQRASRSGQLTSQVAQPKRKQAMAARPSPPSTPSSAENPPMIPFLCARRDAAEFGRCPVDNLCDSIPTGLWCVVELLLSWHPFNDTLPRTYLVPDPPTP